MLLPNCLRACQQTEDIQDADQNTQQSGSRRTTVKCTEAENNRVNQQKDGQFSLPAVPESFAFPVMFFTLAFLLLKFQPLPFQFLLLLFQFLPALFGIQISLRANPLCSDRIALPQQICACKSIAAVRTLGNLLLALPQINLPAADRTADRPRLVFFIRFIAFSSLI